LGALKMPTAIATNVKTSKFPHKPAVGSETRRFRKSWREQLAAYFGKIASPNPNARVAYVEVENFCRG
jgi:hypothetical protein